MLGGNGKSPSRMKNRFGDFFIANQGGLSSAQDFEISYQNPDQ
jgi:hypothetical protein